MGHLNSSHTGYPVRNSMLVALHKQFLLSYARLPARKRLAYEDALLQEAENYQKSVKATYRNLTIVSLGRLKKRPPAMREGDDNTGTLGTELKRNQEREEKEKGRLTRRKVDQYISTKEVLAKWEYLVDVPEQPGGHEPNEEGNIKKCDRVGCGIEFLVHSDLNEVRDFARVSSSLAHVFFSRMAQAEKIACAHHFGRLVTEKLGGKS
jgi:RNA exonuclease 1